MSFLKVFHKLLSLLFLFHGGLTIYSFFLLYSLDSLAYKALGILAVEILGSFLAAYGIWKQKLFGYTSGVVVGLISAYQLFQFLVVYDQKLLRYGQLISRP